MKASLSSVMEQRNPSNLNSKMKPSSTSFARSLHPFFIRTSRFLSPLSFSSSNSCSSSTSSSYPSSSSSSSRHEFSSILRFLSTWRCFSADDVHFSDTSSSDNRITKLSLLEKESENHNVNAAHVRVFRSLRSNEKCKKTPDLNISPTSDSNLKRLVETEECTPGRNKLGCREMSSECTSKVNESKTETNCKATDLEIKKGSVNDMMKDSVAKVQYTYDPCADFYESMREMVMEKGLTDLQQMEEMFACFVMLNSPNHHRHIQKAYTTLLASFFHGKALKLQSPSSSSSSYSFSSSGYGALSSSNARS